MMKGLQLRFWHPIAGLVILGAIDTLAWNLEIFASNRWLVSDLIDWASGVCLLLLLYVIIRNIVRAIKGLLTRRGLGQIEELEHQREIEQKEIDMVRKSNEILLHLIQDQHREGDR